MNAKLWKYVRENIEQLNRSNRDMRALYDIIFRVGDNVLCEQFDGIRIKEITYREIDIRVHRAAKALYDKIGATHRYVGLDAENSPEWITAFWAILMSGNKVFLVNERAPRSITESLMSSLGVEYIVGVDHGYGKNIPFSELDKDGVFTPEWENSVALSTSGTTNNEIACFYTGKEFSEQIFSSIKIIRECRMMSGMYDGNLKHLAFLPFYHIFGLVAVYLWFTFFGRTFVFLNDLSGESILGTCRRHGVTHVFAIPLLWNTIDRQLRSEVASRGEKTEARFNKALIFSIKLHNFWPALGHAFARIAFREVRDKLFGDTLRFAISGGSYTKTSTMSLFFALGYPLHNGFGTTEIGISSLEQRTRPKYVVSGSCGKPFKHYEYAISDEGTLLVRGTALCSSMMVNGAISEHEGWFDTRDFAVRDSKGYYYINGRRSELIIGQNGENFNPLLAEKYIEIPYAVDFTIIGMGGLYDQRPVLIIQADSAATDKQLRAMSDAVVKCTSALPSASRINEIYLTFDSLMPNDAVKINRQFVSRAVNDGTIRLVPFTDDVAAATKPPFDISSPLALKVAAIIAKTLILDPTTIGADDHIITSLGGTSLDYFDITSHISREFGVELYEGGTALYTLREFCEYIERHSENHEG